MEDFFPLNELETALVGAQQGRLPQEEFVEIFLESEVAVPSGQPIDDNFAGFQPLFFEMKGTKMMVCMTDLDRAGIFGDLAPYCITMRGDDLLRRMDPGHGLVVNPRYSVGAEFSPEGIRNIIRNFGI